LRNLPNIPKHQETPVMTAMIVVRENKRHFIPFVITTKPHRHHTRDHGDPKPTPNPYYDPQRPSLLMTDDTLSMPPVQGHTDQSDACSYAYIHPTESNPSRGHTLCQYESSRAIGTRPSSLRAYPCRVCRVMLSRPSPIFVARTPEHFPCLSTCITTLVHVNRIESTS
jgi:hypothetical protein